MYLKRTIPSMMLVLTLLLSAGDAFGATDHFASLRKRLIQDGFNAERIRTLYSQPPLEFDTKGVSLYFRHRESKLNYDQFLDPEPIRKARAYLAAHREALAKAEQQYGVERYVITAILLVETRLGTFTGNWMVFRTLSSMAALSDQAVRNQIWQAVTGDTRLSRSEFEAKSDRKADWAYRELKAFLKYTKQENLNPLLIEGSYAGALGYCQFMPSNILTLARDGNGDGRINLFTHADAIMSVANYLNHHGWHSGISREKAYDAVYHYNHSSYYVNTVLKIADRLKG